MKLTAAQYDDLDLIANGEGFAIQDYSGRFMYGRRCIAFVGEDVPRFLISLTRKLCQNGEFNLVSAMYSDVKTDSMGLDSVVYFPNIDAEIDADESDDTDEMDIPESP